MMAPMADGLEWIDTHCHLAHGRLHADVDGVIARARAAGVTRLICATGTVAESKAAAGLARRHENVWCLAGVHPHEAKDAGEGDLETIEHLAADARNVAIGEIGLDYHYDFSPRADQRRLFAAQLELAVRLGKLVVIHTREAFDETMAILREAGVDGRRVVFHCCTEPVANIRRAVAYGAAVSFSGIVTFKNTGSLREGAAIVPAERLLIETDAPYCSPEPVRKIKTNEPAHVAHVGARLAAVRKTTPEALARLTTANALRLFALHGAAEAS